MRWSMLRLFFFNAPATTSIYTLSLHDALPIWPQVGQQSGCAAGVRCRAGGSCRPPKCPAVHCPRSEEHTSELQSRENLVCRLLLEKKKNAHVLSRRSRTGRLGDGKDDPVVVRQ